MRKIEDYSLYLVISEEYGLDRDAIEIAKRAIKGGIDLIQMREKTKPAEELIKLGKALSDLCKRDRVIFIVNDDPMLAKEVDADGVHLGQEDAIKYPVKQVREMLGSDKIIGISTHSIAQFTAANDEDFDYIAFGPVFETKTKNYFLGEEDVEEVIKIAKKPVFFIGGISLENIAGILKRGAKNIALIRGITEAEDIAVRTKEFKRLLRLARRPLAGKAASQ